MAGFDLVLPWIGCGLALVGFLWIRGWILKHLFGVGFVFADDRHLATVIYCLVLFPGIFIHEATRWIVAGMLSVKHKRIMKWPKADANGKITISFVSIDDRHNPVYNALIGIAPFVIGMLFAIWISTAMLHLPEFVQGLSSNKINAIGGSFQTLISQPDFLLWFYLLFVLSNTLWPTGEDRLGWEIILAIVAGGIIFLLVIGFQAAVLRWFNGPIPQMLNVFTTILLTAIAIDGVVAIIIALLERGAERVTQRSAPYKTALAKTRAARPELPHLTSIMQYHYALPEAPKISKPATAPAASAPKPASGALPTPSTARPSTPTALPTASPTPNRLPPASPAPGVNLPATGSTPLPSASPTPNRTPSTSPLPAAASSANPARPASPIPQGGTPPARPALPATSTAGAASGTGLATTTPAGSTPLRAASPFGGGNPVRPSVSNVAHPDRKEDYIDAETIDEEEANPPTSPPPARPTDRSTTPDRPVNRDPNTPPAFTRSFGGVSGVPDNPTNAPRSVTPAAEPDAAAQSDDPRYEPLDDSP